MRLILLSTSFLVYASVFAQTGFDDPVKYHSFIVAQQHEVVKKNLDYICISIQAENFRLMETKRKAVLEQIKVAKANIAEVPTFENSARLKTAAIKLLSEYENAFEKDYKEVNKLAHKSTNSLDAMEAYFHAQNITQSRVNKAAQQFNEEQEHFVDRHQLTFRKGEESNSLAEKMEHVAALNRYIQVIYIEYFRVSKTFAEMLEVVSEQKKAALDKKRTKVIDIADKALQVLKTLGPFNGNESYLQHTLSLIEFYRGLAKNEFQNIASRFGKKAGIDQQDADYINKVLRDYNKQIERLANNVTTANNNLLKENIPVIQ